jgi:hypothetical protein
MKRKGAQELELFMAVNGNGMPDKGKKYLI